jgi:acetylornithine deacetylase/succinyl-diaminopimelate desuccinylase-like protein
MSAAAKARAYARIEVQREELVAFLRRYVALASVDPGRATPEEPGDEAPCQHWLAETVRSVGVFATVDVWGGAPGRPNVAATRASGGTGAARGLCRRAGRHARAGVPAGAL